MSSTKHLADLGETYQRWEPATLEMNDLKRSAIQMPTAAELEAIHQQAHQEGFDAGFAEGVDAGRQQGQQRVNDEAQRLTVLLQQVTEALSVYDQEVSAALMALALDIARQMLRQALKVKPELLLPIVRSVMETLPQVNAHPHLHLHPEDAALLKTAMQTEIAQGGWKILEDHRLARGGCRIETPTSEIDATLQNRWQRIAAALGQDHAWLDE